MHTLSMGPSFGRYLPLGLRKRTVNSSLPLIGISIPPSSKSEDSFTVVTKQEKTENGSTLETQVDFYKLPNRHSRIYPWFATFRYQDQALKDASLTQTVATKLKLTDLQEDAKNAKRQADLYSQQEGQSDLEWPASAT